jgi:hypothetical protein
VIGVTIDAAVTKAFTLQQGSSATWNHFKDEIIATIEAPKDWHHSQRQNSLDLAQASIRQWIL